MTLDGQKLKKLRLEKGITQLDLAGSLEMNCELISMLENNRRKQIWLCTAYKLAKYFNVKIEELIKE